MCVIRSYFQQKDVWFQQEKVIVCNSSCTLLFCHVYDLTLTEVKKYYSKQHQYEQTWDKTRWWHTVIPIPTELSPILNGLHLWDPWLGCKKSQVQNRDKTSWLLFLLLSSFIIFLFLLTKEHSVLGLTYLCNENLHGHGVSDSDKFYIYPLYNYIPVHFGPGPICDSFRLIASHIFTTYLLMASSLIAFNLFHMKQVSNSCYFPPDFDKKMENE